MPEGTKQDESAAALRNTIQHLLEEFYIEPSVISDALNFAALSPDGTRRFLQEVVRDVVEAAPPMLRLRVQAYRRDPTLLAIRRRVGLALLADAILETEAAPDDCVTTLRDLGLLLNERSGEGVKTVVNHVHYLGKTFIGVGKYYRT